MFAVFAATSGVNAYVVKTKDPAYVAQSAGTASGNVGAGQAMYAKAGCETCHGPNGQGTAAGPRIAGSTRQLPAFVAYARKPTGTMPPQSAQVVSDRALGDILRVSAFRARGPGPLRTRPTRTASAPAGRAEAGAALYAKIGCYQCHSNQAQGRTGGATPRTRPDPARPFLTIRAEPDGRHAAIYREGVVEPGTGRYLCVRPNAAAAAGGEFDSAVGTLSTLDFLSISERQT